jgi:hypothetical protein
MAAGCADSAPSESEAHAIATSMLASPLFEPPPGTRLVETRKDFCGGGSAAPSVERRFVGKTVALEAYYRQRMTSDGWQNIRTVRTVGFAASKGERNVLVEVAPGTWLVSMQQGSEPAQCSDLRNGEEVTSG